jgi:antitoxin YefM
VQVAPGQKKPGLSTLGGSEIKTIYEKNKEIKTERRVKSVAMSKKSITLTEARANLKMVMDDVCKNHAPTVIVRRDGEPAVMLSLADYNSMVETLYLLGNVNNARHLAESITQLKAGSSAGRQFLKERKNGEHA